MNFVFTDLSHLTAGRLMSRTRRQFACSVGLFFLLGINLGADALLPRERLPPDLLRQGLVTFSVIELVVWVSFARSWNELNRRLRADQAQSEERARAERENAG